MRDEPFDYSKLKGKIIEMFGTQSAFIEQISMSNTTFIKKMNNEVYFNQIEIEEIAQVLSIPKERIVDYFFVKKVRNS